MALFDEITARLKARQPLPPLFPTRDYDSEITQQLLAPDDELDSNPALRCGLLVWNDDLHASHEISQSLETPTGSFWHAIIHRREGDPSNSNYWWRRTGDHPAFKDVFTAVQGTAEQENDSLARDFAAKLNENGRWNPIEFVAACERARRSDEDDAWLRRIQVAEIRALLNWCRANPS